MSNTSQSTETLLPAAWAWAPMQAHRVIRVSGEDAADLLQGQFSNDIDALADNPGQLSSYNSPKGRVLAFLRVLAAKDGYWLVVDEEIADAFVQRLRMFVLRSKVDIEPATDIAGMVVTGPRAPEALAEAGLACPASGEAQRAANGLVMLGVPAPSGQVRVEIYGPRDALPSLSSEPMSADELARWDILFRLPRINAVNREAHVAQHLDLDELGAINFRKGCYTGQEIIARMKYLGKVKKRATVLIGDQASAGDTVRTASGRAAGEVVNTAPLDHGVLLLATVNLAEREGMLSVNETGLRAISAPGAR